MSAACRHHQQSVAGSEEGPVEISVQQGDITFCGVKVVVVNLFEGVTRPGGGTGAVDAALGGAISRLIDEGDIHGTEGEMTIVHTLGKLPAGRVLVVGLGKSSAFSSTK